MDIDDTSNISDDENISDVDSDAAIESEDAQSQADDEEDGSEGEEYEVDPQREAADRCEVDAIAQAVDEDQDFRASMDEVKFGRNMVTKVSIDDRSVHKCSRY